MSSFRRMKTAQPPVSTASIPQSLRDIPRWICWDYMDCGDGKKPRKVPIGKGTDYGTNYNDPSAWRTFASVMTEAVERDGLGVGFVFSESDDIVGVDLDNSYDEQGWLKPWAREVAKSFSGAFCEQTPSGLGLHFIGRASKIVGRTRVELPDGDGGIERYSENRWFTFTGNPVTDGDVIDVSDGMTWFENNYFGGRHHASHENGGEFEADAALDIELARVCLVPGLPGREGRVGARPRGRGAAAELDDVCGRHQGDPPSSADSVASVPSPRAVRWAAA